MFGVLIGALTYIQRILCVGISVSLVPYLLEQGPWHQRWAIGVLMAYATHGILWGRKD